MFKHVPDGLRPGAPLVVALHGCGQGAESFDDESGWARLAAQSGFALLLPEQPEANNRLRCFNWFSSRDNRRGEGEAASIIAMIDDMTAKHGIDPGRVFVTGLSAGGAMTGVMLAAYPERFRGGAIFAGTPYGCATTSNSPFLWWSKFWTEFWNREGAWAAWQCGISAEDSMIVSSTVSRSPAEWRGLLGDAGGAGRGAWPKVLLWQGDADRIVDPGNLAELTAQWTAAHEIDQTPDAEITQSAYRRQDYKDAAGDNRVTTFALPSLGHAVPVDPGPDGQSCGVAAPYFSAIGLCAAAITAREWGLSARSGDEAPAPAPADRPAR